MKKLNLKFDGIGEMLTKDQMKRVLGGDYGGYGYTDHSSLCIPWYDDCWRRDGASPGAVCVCQGPITQGCYCGN